MNKQTVETDPSRPELWPAGRLDPKRVDENTEADIARHMAEDDDDARKDAAAYTKRIRTRLGLTQAEFSARINVSTQTIRNWEQGKRTPTGAARTLLRVLDKAPEAAMQALNTTR